MHPKNLNWSFPISLSKYFVPLVTSTMFSLLSNIEQSLGKQYATCSYWTIFPQICFFSSFFSALLKTPVFYSSYPFPTFPLLLLSSCFSVHTQREKHIVFLTQAKNYPASKQNNKYSFKKNLSRAHLKTSKTAVEQPGITDALAVCPTPLKADFDK